jgi:hypothetical protein
MPRTPINYTNTHFYKIVCRDSNIKDCYIGHTTDFKRRKSQHKNVSANMNTSATKITALYQFIRNNQGWDNFDMILIETVDCVNALEARKQERIYIEEFKPSLNFQIPSRTLQEWNIDNNDIIKIKKKQYYETNKDIILIKMKDFYIDNKETLLENHKTYYTQNKDAIQLYAQKYYQDNIEQKRIYNKEYSQQNREQINARTRERYKLRKAIIAL